MQKTRIVCDMIRSVFLALHQATSAEYYFESYNHYGVHEASVGPQGKPTAADPACVTIWVCLKIGYIPKQIAI